MAAIPPSWKARARTRRAGVRPGGSQAHAAAVKINAKPARSATDGRSPRISADDATPTPGTISMPSDAVAAGNRPITSNQIR
jgi:hypothetical protein